MTEWFLKNWLSVIVTVYIISMILYGHRKGFFRIAISTTAIVITLILSNIFLPKVTDFVRQNTEIQQGIKRVMLEGIGMENIRSEDIESKSGQETAVDSLYLPKEVKKMLIDSNNTGTWQKLGVEHFGDYISTYLSNTILNALGFVIVFFVVWLILHILIEILDVVARVPVIHGLNQIFGAVAGLFNALIMLWILSIFISAVSGTHFGRVVLAQINGNRFLSFIFNKNLISLVVKNIIYLL